MEKDDQRNFVLALVLCFGLFIGYNMLVLEPQQRAQREARARAQQEQQVANPSPSVQIRTRDAVVAEDTAAGRRVPIEAASIDGSISLVGGRIDDVAIRNYYETVQAKLAKDESAEVQLLSPQDTDRAFYAVVAWTSSASTTEDQLWSVTSTGPLSETNPVTLTYANPAAVRIDRTIAVDADYMFTVTDTVTNTSAAPITLTPTVQMRQRSIQELLQPSPQAHAGVIGTFGTKTSQMRSYKDLSQGKGVIEDVNAGWVGLTTKYWMAAAIPQQGEPVQMQASVARANGETIFNAGYQATAYTIQPGQSVTKATNIFAGVKRVSVLERYENEKKIPAFTDAVDWSWLFFITKPFFYLLQLFQGWVGSFGIAILMLTVFVKTVFFPLQFNMYKSMSKMRLLAPEMKSIQERFAADPQRMRLEQAALWKREKVNPVAGCLPLIPQMFVFYALYHVLMVTIEMRHAPFLGTWIQDMSAPDPISIFNLFGLIPWNPGSVPLIGGFLMIGPWALLYGITMVLLQGMSAPPTDPMQRAIMRWIPLVFTILFAGFAAGLVIYWVWSNTITLVQQYIIMRRTGVETEFDKFFKKVFGKKNPPDDTNKRVPAK
ncbi:MAG TPA: membrane protein insertase YidC [Hyphomonadaceae bacterium]